jgi:uncharacterized protein (UPF0276 family)
MIIGLNNGGFYRLKYDRLSAQVINTIIKTGANALEFNCLDIAMVDELLNFELPNNKIDFFSIHAPLLEYKDNIITRDVLNKISQISERLSINNIVIHSDNIKDLKVFDSFAQLPLSVENSDNRKDFGRSVSDIKTILDNSNLKLTLDVQHCYVNDQTMKLADEFYIEFSNKITEFHVSGYDAKFNHYSLYKTKQDVIIDFLNGKNVPIILESTYDSFTESSIEYNYIKIQL